MSKAEQKRRYQKFEQLGKLTGTVAGCMRKWEARQANKPQPYTSRSLQHIAKRAKPVLVPLGDYGQSALDERRSQDRRVLWSYAEAGLVRGAYTTGSNSDWKKRSTLQRYLVIESWAKVGSSRIEYHCDGHVFTIKAPRGYRWDSDENGLMLFGRDGDYHPTADDLLAAPTDKCRAMIAKIKNNAAIRKQAMKKAKQQLAMVKRAEREGARICLADSLRAGNCRVGSTNWARNHNLDPAQHYKPSQVLALANGDASRVAIVAAAAIRRHQQEMDRGYCMLSEHQS
jgi:hypothetical protein